MGKFNVLFESAARLDRVGIAVTRIGLIVVLVWIGGLKVFHYEGEGIVPFVANSPLMSFFYHQPAGEYRQHMNREGALVPANREWHQRNGTYPFAYGLGSVIVAYGVMIALHPWFPRVAAAGSFLVVVMSFVTLSFLITTPECWVSSLGSPEHGFPLLSGAGRLVIKDAIMMGAALVTLADSAKVYLAQAGSRKDQAISNHQHSLLGDTLMIHTTKPIRTLALLAAAAWTLGLTSPAAAQQSVEVHHKTVKVGDLDIFYREAGPKDAPTVLLLHGFPTSSQMFRKLIPALGDDYHVVAPDYPGYGHSSMPAHDTFTYTFDNLATVIDTFTAKLGLTKYALYVQDYGAPVGYRLAVAHPERVTAIVVQNGNAYDEGLDNDFWKPLKAYWKEPNSKEKRDALRPFLTYEATQWQYTHGVKNPELVSPDGAAHDQFLLDRKGNDEIQLDMFLSYGSNPPLYPKWQAYFRKYQPPMLIAWGKNDPIFPAAGAEPYKRDLKTLDYHLLDAGHFALETDGDAIARLMRAFLGKHVAQK